MLSYPHIPHTHTPYEPHPKQHTMPFNFLKAHRAQKASVKFTPMPSEPVPAKCFGSIVFTPLDQTPGLLPLGVAQMSPEIVYRSLMLLDQVVEFEQAKLLKLLPLKEAQEMSSIKRRSEGFEVEEVKQQKARWAAIREFIRLDSELPGEI